MSIARKFLIQDQSIENGLLGLYLILIVLFSYYFYPGASICEEDTQIYLPILLKAQDASLLKNDLITQHPHTAFTLFDELVQFMSGFFGLSLPSAMIVLQLISRGLLVTGFFLCFRALRFAKEIALTLAGLMMLGGAIPGAQILIVEYEPVPRGIAFCLTLLGLALVTRQRVLEGTLLACLGFLIHPSTTVPFWIGWVTVLQLNWRAFSSGERLSAAGLPVVAALLLTLAALGPSLGEQSRHFLKFIDPEWEALLKLRTPYVFVSEWSRCDFYLLSGAGLILWLAWRRCRLVTPRLLRSFVVATGLWGPMMVVVSWVLLDYFKLALFPQLQPARALIFMVVFMLILSWTAAARGLAADPFKLENHLWVFSTLSFSLDRTLLLVLWPLLGLEILKNSLMEKNPSEEQRNWIRGSFVLIQLLLVLFAATKPCGLELLSWATAKEVSVAMALSVGLGVLLARGRTWHKLGYLYLPTSTILLFVVLPIVLRKPASTPDRGEIRDLADWAKSATPIDSVFLFPDVGRDKSPGVFRYYASRAVYVDWKSGGQVNFSRSFAREWWERWENTMGGLPKTEIQGLNGKGIDYLVTQKPHSIADLKPVYETRTLEVYRTH